MVDLDARSGVLLNRRSLLKMAGAAGAGWMTGAGALDAQSVAQSKPAGQFPDGAPLIFPPPRQIAATGTDLRLSAGSVILIPEQPSAGDLRLARLVAAELSSRFDLNLPIRPASELPLTGGSILIGPAGNPLVEKYCAHEQIRLDAKHPGPEGYYLRVTGRAAVIAGSDARGAFYGFQSLRQILALDENGVHVRGVRVADWPDKPFRSMYVYLPGPSHLALFERFIRDFAAFYKYNSMMVEMNACMRLDRHPELNTGWIEFARDLNYNRRNYPPGALHGRDQDSSHQDCGDGVFLEKSDVAGLVRIARENAIDFVPVIQSLTHSYYLLSKHKDLSEVPGDQWPDTYCASNPASHRLLFDVVDEFLEVIRPKLVNAGHDEWFAPFGLCPRCRGREPGDVYGEDVRRIHDHLAEKNARMTFWGDYLLENVRGKGLQKRRTRSGWSYSTPGALTPEQVKRFIPKDALILNWFWDERGKGPENGEQLRDFGFQQVYANMEPSFPEYVERSTLAGLIGGAPSLWTASTDLNFSKDFAASLLGCSSLLWSRQPVESHRLTAVAQELVPRVHLRLSGSVPPSTTDATGTLDITGAFNLPNEDADLGRLLGGMQSQTIIRGKKKFILSSTQKGIALAVGVQGEQPARFPTQSPEIAVGRDATSLLFLHACAQPAHKDLSYRAIWDQHDSADLLGWYEVAYEDGFKLTVPVRYGVNILEWNWGNDKASSSYCYAAERAVCGSTKAGTISFFIFEWKNPRLGKVIRALRLRGSKGFRGPAEPRKNAYDGVIAGNAIVLKALSFVPARDV